MASKSGSNLDRTSQARALTVFEREILCPVDEILDYFIQYKISALGVWKRGSTQGNVTSHQAL